MFLLFSVAATWGEFDRAARQWPRFQYTFSLKCWLVSLSATYCNVTQDQEFQSGVYVYQIVTSDMWLLELCCIMLSMRQWIFIKLNFNLWIWTPSMIRQQWSRKWFGVVRRQAIIWANVDPDLCRHMASLSHNELMSLWIYIVIPHLYKEQICINFAIKKKII